MTHPSQSALALYAGQDLGWFRRRLLERHLSRCAECRGEVEAFGALRDDLAEMSELPAVPWNRLAAEMKANIRLGLAAGECVRGEEPVAPLSWFSAGRTMVACASVALLLLAGLFLQHPAPQAPAAMPGNAAELRATANGIELNQDGQTLSLLHVKAGEVTYSAGAQGSMRARYVDADTGNVTINNLYVQ